jgi:alpha/beta superfamily hydrolase
MAFSEEIFKVKTGNDRLMYGVIHRPSNPNGGLVVMFNIGLHYRVSHSLLFVKQARELQQAGFLVARFDPTRIGYSHGDIPPGHTIDNFDAVQTGLFKDDALTVLNYLREYLRPKKIFFSGLCGGALTAAITAAVDKHVDGVIFIAGPITVTSAEYERSTLHPFEADVLFSGYLKRLFSPKAWARFFSGKTSYSDLVNSIKVKLSSRRPTPVISSTKNDSDEVKIENKGNILNGTFLQAFEEIIKSNRHFLFLMPELDRATYDFNALLADELPKRYSAYEKYYSVAKVAKANHTFSRPDTARQLLDISREWLKNRLD